MIKQNILNNKFNKAFTQEYSVFSTLAPEKLVSLFDAQDISYPDYYKLICMLAHFNFKELAHFRRSTPNYILSDNERQIFDEENDEEFEALIEEKGWKLDEEEYVNLFKENIPSEGLIELFSF